MATANRDRGGPDRYSGNLKGSLDHVHWTVEYLVFAFPGGSVSNEIAAELADLVNRKVILWMPKTYATRRYP
jgi:hypothetical protein